MTGQDIGSKVDALVADLQTKGRGQTINILFRNPDNSPRIMPLSSDASGVVNVAQLAAIRTFLTGTMDAATNLATLSVPVTNASNDIKEALVQHEALITASQTASKALSEALLSDDSYQSFKRNLAEAQADADYISATLAYKNQNVAQNYAALISAKGEYITSP